jgi:hypothetical protein
MSIILRPCELMYGVNAVFILGKGSIFRVWFPGGMSPLSALNHARLRASPALGRDRGR